MAAIESPAVTDGASVPSALALVIDRLAGGQPGCGLKWHTEKLNSRVHRWRSEVEGARRSFIVKRLAADVARRNAMVLKRWLPAAGMSQLGPVLLGEASGPEGSEVFHVYEDLGDLGEGAWALEQDKVEAAVSSIAELHLKFASHPLLGECRRWGGDLGIHFYTSNLKDAARALAALQPPKVPMTAAEISLRDRLLARLEKLSSDASRRSALMSEAGGPETLLHGDLWTKNVFVTQGPGGYQVRMIDWDHAAVGPFSYDLSTFLFRFPAHQRRSIVEIYRRRIEPVTGDRFPALKTFNQLCETAELSRISNRLIWPAIALLEGDCRWGFAELEEIERWFQALEPVLPGEGMGAS